MARFVRRSPFQFTEALRLDDVARVIERWMHDDPTSESRVLIRCQHAIDGHVHGVQGVGVFVWSDGNRELTLIPDPDEWGVKRCDAVHTT